SHRQRCLLQPLACFRSERVSAGEPLTVAQKCEEPVGLGVRPGVRGELRDIGDPCGARKASRRGADRRGLWIREDNSWHRFVVRNARFAEDVRSDDIALVFADVSERDNSRDVADGPYAFARAEVRVDLDAALVDVDTDGLETQAADPRTSPRRDEQPIATE